MSDTFYGPSDSKNQVEAQHTLFESGVPLTKLDDSEVAAMKDRMAAVKQLLGSKIRAKYKIELQFGKNRSAHNQTPFAGALVLHTSGTKLHGGGDEGLYMCPQAGCTGVVGVDRMNETHGYCSRCKMWYPRVVADKNGNILPKMQLVNPKMFKLVPANWAHVVLNYFQALDHMADIYLKFHPSDIRVATRVAMARQSGAEDLSAAKAARIPAIYPLANIIKDASSGSNLYKCFFGFLTA